MSLRQSIARGVLFDAHEKMCDAVGYLPHLADIGKILKSSFTNVGAAAFRKINQFRCASHSFAAIMCIVELC